MKKHLFVYAIVLSYSIQAIQSPVYPQAPVADGAATTESKANSAENLLTQLEQADLKRLRGGLNQVRVPATELFERRMEFQQLIEDTKQKLKVMGPKIVPTLIDHLTSQSGSVCSICTELLIYFGDDSIKPVIDRFEYGLLPITNKYGLDVIRGLGQPAVSAILKEIETGSKQKVKAASQLLAGLVASNRQNYLIMSYRMRTAKAKRLMDIAMAPDLLKAIRKQKDPEVRANLVSCLAEFGAEDMQLRDGVCDILRTDPDSGARVEAAKVLGTIFEAQSLESAAPTIESLSHSLLEDKNSLVRIACAQSLNQGATRHGRVTNNFPPIISSTINLQDDGDAISSDNQKLLSGGVQAVVKPNDTCPANLITALQKSTHDSVDAVRQAALQALCNLAPTNPSCIPDVVTALNENDATTVHLALFSLSRIKPPVMQAIPKVLEYAENNWNDARWRAMATLASWGATVAPQAVPVMIRILKSHDNRFTGQTLNALNRMGPLGKAALPVVKELCNSSDFAVNRLANKLVKEWTEPDDDPKLLADRLLQTRQPQITQNFSDPDGMYMADLFRRIKRAWFPPRGQESLKVVVAFKVSKLGQTSNLRVVTSSGNAAADKAALDAVTNASPFRPPLEGCKTRDKDGNMNVQFTFDYNVFRNSNRSIYPIPSSSRIYGNFANPNYQNRLLGAEPKTASEYYRRGVRCKNLGWIEKSRIALNKAIELDPKGEIGVKAKRFLITQLPVKNVPDSATQRNIVGFNQMVAGKRDEAIRTFEELIKEYPDFEWPYTNLANLYASAGDYAKGKEWAQKAVKVNPNHINAWIQLMTNDMELNDIMGAHSAFDKIVQLDPACPNIPILKIKLNEKSTSI